MWTQLPGELSLRPISRPQNHTHRYHTHSHDFMHVSHRSTWAKGGKPVRYAPPPVVFLATVVPLLYFLATETDSKVGKFCRQEWNFCQDVGDGGWRRLPWGWGTSPRLHQIILWLQYPQLAPVVENAIPHQLPRTRLPWSSHYQTGLEGLEALDPADRTSTSSEQRGNRFAISPRAASFSLIFHAYHNIPLSFLLTFCVFNARKLA